MSERILITHDGVIFAFSTKNGEALPSTLFCIHTPTKNEGPICVSEKYNKHDYLDIDTSTHPIDVMVPTHYFNNGHKVKLSTSYTHLMRYVEEHYGNSNFSSQTLHDPFYYQNGKLRLEITRSDTYLSIPGYWNLRYANYKFVGLPPNTKVEYAPTLKSFISICQRYTIHNIFGEEVFSIAFDFDKTEGRAELYAKCGDGHYDTFVKYYVKRVSAKTAGGHYFFSLMLQRLLNEHENMVRIYQARFDKKGEYYEIAMEICHTNLKDLLLNGGFQDPRCKKKFLRGIVQGILNLHNNSVVHGRIRPHNILVNMPISPKLPMVPKLGGMSKCKSFKGCIGDPSKGLFTRDLFDFARVILAIEIGHIISDDDDQNEACYESIEKFKKEFKSDMDKLLQSNPLAHDLVEKLVACKSEESISAEQVYHHFYLWEDGQYLAYLRRASNAIFGDISMKIPADKKMKSALIQREKNVFIGNWKSEVDSQWLAEMEKIQNYDGTKITSLLQLVRNTDYYLTGSTWNLIGGSPKGFEKYILGCFPNLFPNVYHAVIESGNTTFEDFY